MSRAPRGQSGRSTAMGSKDPRHRRDAVAERTYVSPLEVDKAGRVCIRPAGGMTRLDPNGATTEDLASAFNDLVERLMAAGLMER